MYKSFKICHSVLPHIITFCSLILLTITAIQKSHYYHSDSCFHCKHIHQPAPPHQHDKRPCEHQVVATNQNKPTIFTEPTQLVICLSILNILFDFAEVIEWFYAKLIIPHSIQSFTQNINPNFHVVHTNTNTTTITNVDSRQLLTNTLNSSMLLTRSIHQMRSIHFTTGLLRIWASQRYLFTLPILLCQSSKFLHLIKYYFQYYFQTLKMLHVCKISFTSDKRMDSIIIEQAMNTIVSRTNSNDHTELAEMKTTTDEEISSSAPQQQQLPQQIRVASEEDRNIQRDVQRIPSLYCCSCIAQTRLPNVVVNTDRQIRNSCT
ncbi:unnamed protein product [Schistosoma turkestanicum]|nr:unnamed protein product [Schistosoma turkestanicum]